jgi:hypothetical protein
MKVPLNGDWISTCAAAELVGIPPSKMCKLARSGAVKSIKLPGVRRLVSASSVRELAEKSIRQPATAMA